VLAAEVRFSIFVLFVPTTTSSFPSLRNQLPHRASVVSTSSDLILLFFDLIATTCLGTNYFVLVD